MNDKYTFILVPDSSCSTSRFRIEKRLPPNNGNRGTVFERWKSSDKHSTVLRDYAGYGIWI